MNRRGETLTVFNIGSNKYRLVVRVRYDYRLISIRDVLTRHHPDKLPGRFEELVRLMAPQAIADDVQLENTTEMIDRLMTIAKLSKGQAIYLETLTQLVEVYESEHHAIDTGGVTGLESLKYLLDQNQMSGSDLAKLLGIHARMESKILEGGRKLTADHLRKPAKRFHVEPSLFL